MVTGKGDGQLNEQQAKYVEARGMGMIPLRAAKYAGYLHPTNHAYELEKLPHVRAALIAILSQNAEISKITREKVLNIATDAIEIARDLQDPTAMLKGVSELAKLLGYYTPETKTLILTAKRAKVKGELSHLSEDELIELADGYRSVLEGEFAVMFPDKNADTES